jgi:hypothetical protein
VKDLNHLLSGVSFADVGDQPYRLNASPEQIAAENMVKTIQAAELI